MHYPSIVEKFYQYEQQQSEQLFLSEPVRGSYHNFTWQQAGEQIRKMATALQSMGYEPGSKIAILGKNSAHWMMADLAINMAGYVSVPMYPSLSADMLNSILVHSESKLIFLGKLDNYDAVEPGVPASMPKITFPFYPNRSCQHWDDVIANHQPLKENFIPQEDALACILYTSGTTGTPKGVMHSFKSSSFAVMQFLEVFDDFDHEIFFSYLPLCHVAERMLVQFGVLYTGGTVYFVESLDSFSKNLSDTQPTIFLAVPRIWEKFREEILKKIPQKKLNLLLSIPLVNGFLKKTLKKKLGLGRAKYIFTGASPISPALLHWFAKLGIIIQEAYGMTENNALSHVNTKKAPKFGTVGQTYSGVTVRLGNEEEVQVKSDASMLGYYKEPALTAECFEDGFLKTGDTGSIDAEGYLTITGRIKDQFKTSKGKYVAPAPIENKIAETGLAAQVCVVGSGITQPLALVVLTESAKQLSQSELVDSLTGAKKQLNATLEHHEQVSSFVVMKEDWTIANDMLTPTMKIKRRMIDARYGSHYNNWSDDKAAVLFA
jgi:long-chain acyl-CoA synthetase